VKRSKARVPVVIVVVVVVVDGLFFNKIRISISLVQTQNTVVVGPNYTASYVRLGKYRKKTH